METLMELPEQYGIEQLTPDMVKEFCDTEIINVLGYQKSAYRESIGTVDVVVKVDGTVYTARMPETSIKACAKAWGKDLYKWVGQKSIIRKIQHGTYPEYLAFEPKPFIAPPKFEE